MVSSLRTRWQAASRRQRILIILAALYLLYVALGFLVVSPLARQQVADTLSDTTGREVRLEKLLFNPLLLSVTANNFALLDDDGTEFVAFDRFHANFQLSSLFRRSWHFREISLEQPRVQVTQFAEGRFNFDDLLTPAEELPADEASGEPDAEDNAMALPAVSFGRFTLSGGDFRFVDQSRDTVQQLALAPVSFSVLDFSTRGTGEDDNQYSLLVSGPGGGSFSWEGGFSVDPLLATGKLAITGVDLPPFAEFIGHQLHFTVPSGQLDFQTAYRVETGADGIRAWLTDGAVTLRDLVIHDPAQSLDVVQLPLVALGNVRLDTPARILTLGELAITEPLVRARLLDNGLDLAALFEPVTPEDTGEPAPAIETDTAPGEPWALVLETLRLADGSVAFRDETLPEAGELAITPINLTLHDLALNDPRRFSLDGALTLAESGQIALGGEGQIAPLDITLTINAADLPLSALEPWVQSALLVTVPEGAAAAELTINASGDEDVGVIVSGSAGITGLRINESRNRRLLTLDELALQGVRLDTAAQRISLQRASVSGLDAIARVDSDGLGVADRILPPTDEAPESTGEPWAIQLDELRISDSRTRYADQSLTPHFAIGLTRINGTLRELDAAGSRPAGIDLTARVDDYAPLSIKGRLNPLASTPMVDLDVTLDGYEMTGLTPFTGRYLGYVTRTGQLGINSNVKLDGSLLESSTRVKAASFFLGDRVDSPEAMSIPIKLGLAVIRDRNELIDLPVQARGDLNDPSVSVHGIILRALTNILVRAATSPFSVLAGLVGGEDLQHLTFPAGSAEIDTATREQLAALAQVLADRPTLSLTLAGSADTADREALAALVLGHRLTGGDWTNLESALDQTRFQRRVLAQYEEANGQPADTLLPPLPEGADRAQRDAFQQQLAGRAFAALAQQQAASVDAEMLRGLATRRANDAKTALMDDFGLAGERLRISSPAVDGAEVVQGVNIGLVPD